jgi:hypothetical protein
MVRAPGARAGPGMSGAPAGGDPCAAALTHAVAVGRARYGDAYVRPANPRAKPSAVPTVTEQSQPPPGATPRVTVCAPPGLDRG